MVFKRILQERPLTWMAQTAHALCGMLHVHCLRAQAITLGAPLHSCSDVHEHWLHQGTCQVLQPGSRLWWEGVQGLVSTLTPSELTFGMVKNTVTQHVYLPGSTVRYCTQWLRASDAPL